MTGFEDGLVPSATPTIGVLGLYSTRVDGFDTDDVAVSQIVPRHAAVALARCPARGCTGAGR
jgi:hypothetical protein